MAKGSVVLYKGSFLYGVVNVFSDLIAEGFRDAGYETAFIDLSETASFGAKLQSVLNRGDCAMIFSFGGIGAEIKLPDGRPLHDALKPPFVAAMVDHPAHFTGRFAMKNVVAGCFDPSHCDYLRRRFGRELRSFSLPHGGCPPPKPFEGPYEKRPFETIFPASFMNPAEPERVIASMNEADRKLLADAMDFVDSADSVPTHEALLRAARAAGLDVSTPRTFALFSDKLFHPFEHLVRARRRMKALLLLDEAGVAVDIFGEGWPQGLFKNHRVRPSLAFDDALNAMSSAKIVLNLRAIPGSHERVVSAAMAGALVVSDFSDCLAGEFKEGAEISLFRWTKLSELPALARSCLADAKASEDVAEAGKARAFSEHSWQARAKDVLRNVLP